MRFDGSTVLRKILDHPDIFPFAKQVDEVARKLIVGKLKTAEEIDELKRTCRALGPDMFKMVADGLSDAEAKAIVGKVDPRNKEAKSAGGPAQRVLLVELGTGTVDPRAAEVKKAAPKPRAARSGAGKAMNSLSTKATRSRGPRT